MAGSNWNPFARREEHHDQAILTYKIFSLLSWLLVVITTVYYTANAPEDDVLKWRHSIWEVNKIRATPFAQNEIITSIYWIVLFILQIGYVWSLFSTNAEYVSAAASVGSHFIVNNLLQFAFVMLFVRGHFVWAELILVANFFNLSSLYFRHNTSPRFIHVPVVTGPLAWTFVALYWNGAIAVNAHTLVGRIIANVFIWGILVYGLFFLFVYKDYTMGFALSVLSASIGVGQFLTHAIALQWIFAFVIMALLFIASVLIGIPGLLGKDFNIRREGAVVSEDQERAPLLNDA